MTAKLTPSRAYARQFPDRCILLLDTYDTLNAAHMAATVGQEMAAAGQRLAGVRLDSGDFDALSRQVRRILDDAGLDYVRIVASGGLDEYELARLVAAGAPIDLFGRGHPRGRVRRCPVVRPGVQDGGLRRPAGDEIERGQGVPAGGQTGFPAL